MFLFIFSVQTKNNNNNYVNTTKFCLEFTLYKTSLQYCANFFIILGHNSPKINYRTIVDLYAQLMITTVEKKCTPPLIVVGPNLKNYILILKESTNLHCPQPLQLQLFSDIWKEQNSNDNNNNNNILFYTVLHSNETVPSQSLLLYKSVSVI